MLTLHVCFTLNYIFVPKYLSTCTVYTVYNIYVCIYSVHAHYIQNSELIL